MGSAQQGQSVSLSADGNTAIVGGPGDNNSETYAAGAAWVWTRSGGVWTQQGTKLVGSGAVGIVGSGGVNASQGFSVSLSADGNTAIVGGVSDSSQAGAAWVWTRSGGVWTQQGKLVGTGSVSGTVWQGQSLSLSGDGNTAILGGPYDNANAGAAWVFSLCPVDLLGKPKFPSLGYVESGLTLNMLAAIASFENAIGSAHITKTSGYRSTNYQAHLYEIWSNANKLRQVSGIQIVSSNPLQFAAIPGCPACQAEVDELNAEITDHFPNTFPSIVAKHSLHIDGNAVDWTIFGYSDAQIKAIASANNLDFGKVPSEPWHFSLKTAPVGHRVLVAAHSPVNILVTDPNGRRVGYDPFTASVVNEIGTAATYSGLGTTPQTVEIDPSAVLFGEYVVSGTGTGAGSYTIDIQVDTADDVTVQTTLATGFAQAGQQLATIPPINAIATTLRISYSVESGNLILSGPSWATNAVVQWTTNFTSNSWNVLQGTFDPVNGLVVTNQIIGTKFFRLKLP